MISADDDAVTASDDDATALTVSKPLAVPDGSSVADDGWRMHRMVLDHED